MHKQLWSCAQQPGDLLHALQSRAHDLLAGRQSHSRCRVIIAKHCIACYAALRRLATSRARSHAAALRATAAQLVWYPTALQVQHGTQARSACYRPVLHGAAGAESGSGAGRGRQARPARRWPHLRGRAGAERGRGAELPGAARAGRWQLRLPRAGAGPQRARAWCANPLFLSTGWPFPEHAHRACLTAASAGHPHVRARSGRWSGDPTCATAPRQPCQCRATGLICLLGARGSGRPLERDELLREGYQLRQDVCEALLARRQELEPFIVGRFDVYVDNMMREGSWGGARTE